MLTLRQISTTAELERLIPAWRELAVDSPMIAPDWLATWWRHLGASAPSAELCVLAIFNDQDELVAVAPWYFETSRLHGRLLRFLGCGATCTDYLTIPCKTGWQRAAVERLTQWLAGNLDGQDNSPSSRPPAWDMLYFDCVDSNDLTMRLLLENVRKQGALTDVRPATNCWRLVLPPTWDEYLALLSKSHRKRVRRLDRTYFESGRAVLHVVKSEAELEQAFSILTELHEARWTSKGAQGVFDEPRMTAFHRSAMSNLLKAGQLRLTWLELDGQAVAAEYSLTGGRTIYAYQSGMAPSAAEHEPGSLSLIATLKDAIQQGYQAVDFLRGDEPYKQHWRAAPTSNVEIRIFPGRWPHRLRHSFWLAGRRAKTLLRTGRNTLRGALQDS